MSRKKHFQKSRQAAERVVNSLDRLSGRGADRSKRPERSGRQRGPRGVRYLTIRGNEALFRRLCCDDFQFLMSQNIDAPGDILEVLLPQSVVGRAQNGHGWFVDEYGSPLSFREATFDRVLTQLEETWPHLRHDKVRQRRTLLTEAVQTHVMANIHNPRMNLETGTGPMLGAGFLAEREVDTKAFLTGMVLAGFMDDIDHRRETRKQYSKDFSGDWYELGGGEIRVVNRGLFQASGIVDAGQDAWDDHGLEELERLGVLIPADEKIWEYPQYDQVYFRRRLGDGVCDDLALIAIGVRHGLDAMLGAFVMDGLDTYDKFLSRFTTKGSDTRLAEDIQAAWREKHGIPLVPDAELFDLIWFAAKNNSPRVNMSSSHRRLLQTEAGAGVPTVLHHWRFIEGKPLTPIKLGFARVPAEEFYRAAYQRCRAAGHAVPEPTIRTGRSNQR
jgi:hypothetical protein